MRSVPRHKFVPSGYQQYAYRDTPLPIGYGQTISQPYIVAYMTALLQVKANSKVLEIGTGSGYQVAVLSGIVDKVFSIEIYEQLGKAAKKRLQKLAYSNVRVEIGDGYYGWKDKGSFDAIIVTCAAGFVPPPLIRQLKKGGVMCIPVGQPYQVQNLYVIKKKDDGKLVTSSVAQVMFVPLIRKTN